MFDQKTRDVFVLCLCWMNMLICSILLRTAYVWYMCVMWRWRCGKSAYTSAHMGVICLVWLHSQIFVFSLAVQTAYARYIVLGESSCSQFAWCVWNGSWIILNIWAACDEYMEYIIIRGGFRFQEIILASLDFFDWRLADWRNVII